MIHIEIDETLVPVGALDPLVRLIEDMFGTDPVSEIDSTALYHSGIVVGEFYKEKS